MMNRFAGWFSGCHGRRSASGASPATALAIIAAILVPGSSQAFEDHFAGDLTIVTHLPPGQGSGATPGLGAARPEAIPTVVEYSNVATYLGQGITQGPAALVGASGITRLLMDDITPTGANAGQDVTDVRFSVYNANAVTVSARARIRFWFDAGGSPGLYYDQPADVGFTFNPFSFPPGVTIVSSTIGAGLFHMPGGTFWAGLTFDNNNGSTGATLTQLGNLGQGIYGPPTVGTSADGAMITAAAGSFFAVDAPAVTPVSLGGAPPVSLGWEFTSVDTPENDTCAGAIEIQCGEILLAGSTLAALNNYDLCPGNPTCSSCTGSDSPGRDVVYVIHAQPGMELDVSLDDLTGFYPTLYLVADCNDVGASCVAGADYFQRLQYTFTNTADYYLVVDGLSMDGGDFGLSGTLGCPPANDRCDGAVEIVCGPIAIAGTTVYAGDDYDLCTGSPCTGTCTGHGSPGDDVVYLIHAEAGNALEATLHFTDASRNASLYLVTDCGDVAASCVAGKDAASGMPDERLYYHFLAAGTYYLIVDGREPGGTAFTLAGSLDCVPASTGISLAWDDCGAFGARDKSWACDANTGDPFVLVGSFVPHEPLPEFLGFTAELNIFFDGPVPPWWEHDPGACRGNTGIEVDFNFTDDTIACFDFFEGAAAGGFAYDIGFETPNRARLRIQAAVPFDSRGAINRHTEYEAFRVRIHRTKATGPGSCAGCAEPATIVLNEIQLFQPPEAHNDPILSEPVTAGSNVVTWQSATVSAPEPEGSRFALHGVTAGAGGRDLAFALSIPTPSPLTLEVFDVSGRRLASEIVPAAEPGARSLSVPVRPPLPVGIYMARARQGGASVTRKFIVLR